MIAHQEEHKVEFDELLDVNNVHYDAAVAIPLKWFEEFYAHCLAQVRNELCGHYKAIQAPFPVLIDGFPAPSQRFSTLIAGYAQDQNFLQLTQ